MQSIKMDKVQFEKRLRSLLTTSLFNPESGDISDEFLLSRERSLIDAREAVHLLDPSQVKIERARPQRVTVDAHAIDRILDATGLTLVRPTKNGKSDVSCKRVKEEFRRSLQLCKSKYDLRNESRYSKDIAKKISCLDELHKIANELEAALKRCVSEGILIEHPLAELSNQTRLARLVLGLEQGLRVPSKLKKRAGKGRADRTATAFDWLIGGNLAQVYEDYFGTPPTLSRDRSNNIPNSPFVRYANQTLIEFGVRNRGKNYSRASILKSLSDFRTGRLLTRRLPKPTTQLGSKKKKQ
jgi:hypothetical protein